MELGGADIYRRIFAPIDGDDVSIRFILTPAENAYIWGDPEFEVQDTVLSMYIHVTKRSNIGYEAQTRYYDHTFEDLESGDYLVRALIEFQWENEDEPYTTDTLEHEFSVLERPEDYPDLTLTEFVIEPDTLLSPQDSFRVAYTIANIGEGDAHDSTITVIDLKVDNDLEFYDSFIRSLYQRYDPPLEAGDRVELTTPYLTIPEDFENGRAYIFIRINRRGSYQVYVEPVPEYYFPENNMFCQPIWIGDPVVQSIALRRGWNLISSNLYPLDYSITEIFSALNANGSLLRVNDSEGRFYYPAHGYDGIHTWNPLHAYYVKMAEMDTLILTGYQIPPDTPLPLRAGWNMPAYLPAVDVRADSALAGIAGNLNLLKDGSGRFYAPAFGYNSVPPMQPGKGYLLHVSNADTLIWRVPDE